MIKKNYDIILRPHHVKNFISFESKKLFQLSDKDYIIKFREKNKGYHGEQFIIYLKNFLYKLHCNSDLKFLYIDDFDTICDCCDIKDECSKNDSELQKLVRSLDVKTFFVLGLKNGFVYSILELKDLFGV